MDSSVFLTIRFRCQRTQKSKMDITLAELHQM